MTGGRDPRGDAAPGDEQVPCAMLGGDDQGKVEEKAIRGEVKELEGKGPGC